MDQSMNSPYYQGYEVHVLDRRPYRTGFNQSFLSDRDLERDRQQRNSSADVRRITSFHGGAADRELTQVAKEELNHLYSGKIPLYGPSSHPDISFMMDRVKEDITPKEQDSKPGTSVVSMRQVLTTLGAGGVQVGVGFFFAATHLTLVSHLVSFPHLLEGTVRPNLPRVVFLAFSALASAFCAVLVATGRYRKLVSSGAILLILSCLSASLVTNGRFMFLSYGVMAGSAHGILRTVSMVAAADVSPDYRVTSVSCATLGHAVGGILGTFVYYYFMTDYLTPGTWTNNFRILELVAVVALLSGSVFRRPRAVTSRSLGVRSVMSDFGVHCVTVLYGLTFLAVGVLQYLIPVLPAVRGFQSHKFQTFFNPFFALYCGQWVGTFALALTGSVYGKAVARACLFVAGVFVFLLGVAVIPHDLTYDTFWAYMGLSFGVGIAVAFAQTLVTVGVSRRMGSSALGVSVSLLMFWQDVGTMLGSVCVEELNGNFTMEVALYMCGGILLFTGLAFIPCCYTVVPLAQSSFSYSSSNDNNDNGARDRPRVVGLHHHHATTPTTTTNNNNSNNHHLPTALGQWDAYEADYRYMH